jgi:hypothetical protein
MVSVRVASTASCKQTEGVRHVEGVSGPPLDTVSYCPPDTPDTSLGLLLGDTTHHANPASAGYRWRK